MKIDYDKVREQVQEAVAQEADDKQVQITTLDWIVAQFQAWKRWYLKKNQQANYFRVTRIVPPGMEANQFAWVMNFQIWVKGKVVQEHRIDNDTFLFFYNQLDWVKSDTPTITSATLKPLMKIVIGREYEHDGMRGVAEWEGKKIIVKSGSDGFYPLDVQKWGGTINEIKK